MKPFKASPFYFDFSLLKFLVLFYLAAYFIDFISVYLSSLETTTPIKKSDLLNLLITYIFYYFTKFLYIYLALVFTKKFIFHGKKIALKSSIHVFLASLLSFYTAFVQLIVNKYVFSGTVDITLESIYIRGLNSLSFNFFVYFSMVAILYAYNYLKKEKENELKQISLQAQLFDSKIKALQSQLQPHFLFNALNDISSLMEYDISKSQNAIADLSDLLRDTLNLSDSKFITLKKELNLLEKYIELEKIRFDSKLEFEVNIESKLLKTMVPPLFLQPIIENSIKHGFSLNHDFLKIGIEIKGSKEKMKIQITNNGKPLSNEEPVLGTGISNVLSRFDSLYDGDFSYGMKNIEKNMDTTLVVTNLVVPILDT